MKALTVIILLGLVASNASGEPRRGYRLAGDRVTLEVDGSWEEVRAKAGESVSFQIPNPADEDTPDSANATIVARTLGKEPFEDRITRVAAKLTVVTRLPKAANSNDVLLVSRGKQGDTPYVVVDRLARRNGVEIHIRVAWPILPATTADWQSQLIEATNQLISGVAVDATPIGMVGKVVERGIEQDGKVVRVIEAVE
jgi:hypothetical protein